MEGVKTHISQELGLFRDDWKTLKWVKPLWQRERKAFEKY